MSFGLTEYEARVYLALVLKSPQKASALALASGISRPHIYSTLKDLQEKGLIKDIPKKVVEYRALPATEAFYLLIEKRKRSINDLEEMSKDLAQRLENKDRAQDIDAEKGVPRNVYQGRWNIINAIREMVSKARTSCDFITNKPDDAHFAARVFDREISELKRRGLKTRVLMPVNGDNLAILSSISGIATVKHIGNPNDLMDLAVSNAEHSFGDLCLRVLIIDGSDVVFITTDRSDNGGYAFQTKQKEIVTVTKLVYFNLWNNAQDFVSRKAEIENGVGVESIMSISGDMKVVSTATSIMSHASSEAYGILYEHQFIYNLATVILEARVLAAKGIKVRLMVDINSDISTAISAFKETGAEIRYNPLGNMVKLLMSDTEAIVYVVDENVNMSDDNNLCIYTNQREAISRLIGRFEREWEMSIDADDRIKQLR
jgi:sugar-specific transcriptional regulator TrmB